MELMLPVIDIKLPNKGISLTNTSMIPKLGRLILVSGGPLTVLGSLILVLAAKPAATNTKC